MIVGLIMLLLAIYVAQHGSVRHLRVWRFAAHGVAFVLAWCRMPRQCSFS